jgi:hypothetical protein
MKRTMNGARDIEAEVDAELEQERDEASDAFSTLYADYLEARARMIRPGKSDEAIDKLCEETDALLWRIIHMPAPTPRHLDYKFEIMRELVEERFGDSRSGAMVESIRNDAFALADQ